MLLVITTILQRENQKKYALATHSQYQIMEMLMVNSGQVISTERFMEKVWGYDSEAEINVVWVNISGLRKKISELGASVQIKAARGVGYSLELIQEK